jgi:hypothetical protein
MNSAQQTTITHNGQTATINARVGDIITKRQMDRLVKLFGTNDFSDGHQVFHHTGGGANYRTLRFLATATR